MAEYVSIPTQTDPDALAQDAFDYLGTKSPAWAPHDGQLDVWLIAAVARMIATLGDTLTDVQASIFRYWGAYIVGIAPIEASSASGSLTFTAIDTAGHKLPAGFAVAVPTGDGGLVPFETTEELTIAGGSSTGTVPITAVEAGSEGGGLGVLGTVVTMLDELSWIKEAKLAATTAGGSDAEEDAAYLNRLVAEMRLLAPRPIVPNDFAELARTVPGVARALAVNGYNPSNGLFTNERTVAIACVDNNGAECSAPIKTAVQTLLLGKREVNFIINMIAVTYTKVSVEWEVRKWPEWNASDVQNRIEEALRVYLSPSDFGQPPFGDQTLWYPRTEVKLKDIIAVIGSVSGVEDVLKVKLKSGAGAYEEKDIVLAGAVAQLPEVGTVNAGTVV